MSEEQRDAQNDLNDLEPLSEVKGVRAIIGITKHWITRAQKAESALAEKNRRIAELERTIHLYGWRTC